MTVEHPYGTIKLWIGAVTRLWYGQWILRPDDFGVSAVPSMSPKGVVPSRPIARMSSSLSIAISRCAPVAPPAPTLKATAPPTRAKAAPSAFARRTSAPHAAVENDLDAANERLGNAR
jgi:hypothetical protein